MSLFGAIKQALRRRRLSKLTPQEIFSDYARTNKWGDDASLSGKGSNLEATTKLRQILPELLRELGATSMLDLPCGDFFWMSHVDLNDIDYIGGDIVPDLIATNQVMHSSSRRRFEVIDLIAGPIPAADVIFVRDCLVHLSNTHVEVALRNIAKSGGKWLLTTTFPNTAFNEDIVTGQWRAIDLTLAPFSLPMPERLVAEGQAFSKGQGEGKMLGLWSIDILKERLS